VLKGIAAAVVAGFAVLLVVALFAAGDTSAVWFAVAATIVLYVVLLWAAWRYSVGRYRCSWPALGLRPLALGRTGRTMAAGLFATLLIAVVYGAVIQALGQEDRLKSPSFFDDPTSAERAAIIVLAVAVAPLVEETFFRGFVFQGLRRRLGLWGAAAAASALFALAHVDPIAYAPIFCIGMVLAWLFARTGSLVSSMLVHAAYNGVVVGLAYSV